MEQRADRAGRGARGGLLLVLLLLSGCGQAPPEIAELSGGTMGTSYSIKLSPAPDEDQRTLLQQQVESRLEAINAQMSTYRPDSALTRFNRARSTEWLAVPESLVELVRRAATISRLSEGRYDVTVGPLVDLWGFGGEGPRGSPPAAAELAVLQTLYRGRGLTVERGLADVHSGRIFASTGTLIMDAVAVFMIVLSLSGFVLWLQHSRREAEIERRNGRRR